MCLQQVAGRLVEMDLIQPPEVWRGWKVLRAP